MKYFLPLLVIVLLGFLFWKGLSIDPRRLPSTLIDKPAPVFEVPTLYDNNQQISQESFIGQVTLLNVWASWCTACRHEHAEWMKITARYPEYQYLGLNYRDRPEAAQAWLKELGNPYRLVGLDPSGRVGIEWGVYGTPETFVIDRQGIVRYKHVGPMTEVVWENTILLLLKQL